MSEPASVPTSLPDVVLLEPIARTNVSEVWKGSRRSDGAAVVVKFPTTASGPDTLRQEARTVEALRAAGVAGIVPAEFRAEPAPHLVLPWKGARTLRDAMAAIRGGDDRSRVLGIYLRIVETVAAVHREGVLHGDLKPENVLLDDNDRPWLADFGMARAIRSVRLDTHVSRSMSESGGGWGGTLHYLPPEGIHGEAPTQAWDVYALGVMLHEILLGARPDRAATPENLKAVLPEQVVQVLLDALAYSPQDRISSARALLPRLREIAFELTARGPLRWFVRSGRLALTGLAAFFVALRYGFVLALVVGYLAILASVFTEPLMLFMYLPFLLLHLTIRWEGPETTGEAALRRSGNVVARR